MSLDQFDPNKTQKRQITDLTIFINEMDKIVKKIDKHLVDLDIITSGYGIEPDAELKPYYNKMVKTSSFIKVWLGDLKVYTYSNSKKYKSTK
jgi:hypothetical protein